MTIQDIAERNTDIINRRKSGQTLQFIGNRHNLSRERVRQICDVHEQEIEDLEGAPIEFLLLSNRALNALHANEIHTIPTLESVIDLCRLRGVGIKCANEILFKLLEHDDIEKTRERGC